MRRTSRSQSTAQPLGETLRQCIAAGQRAGGGYMGGALRGERRASSERSEQAGSSKAGLVTPPHPIPPRSPRLHTWRGPLGRASLPPCLPPSPFAAPPGAVHSGVPAWLLVLIMVERRARDSPKSQTCECDKRRDGGVRGTGEPKVADTSRSRQAVVDGASGGDGTKR